MLHILVAIYSVLGFTQNVSQFGGGLPIKVSATGTRTQVARVRAEYPNQLDYSGVH